MNHSLQSSLSEHISLEEISSDSDIGGQESRRSECFGISYI